MSKRRHLLLRLCIVVGGIATVAPSPEAIDPYIAPPSAFLDDDFSGSGLETGDATRAQPSRRPIRRLRLRPDEVRAGLLRAINTLPTLADECFPECRGNAAALAVLLPLLRARYEGQPLAMRHLIEESRLPPAMVEAAVRTLVANGLAVSSELNIATGANYIAPTPELYRRSGDFVDRVHDLLAGVVED